MVSPTTITGEVISFVIPFLIVFSSFYSGAWLSYTPILNCRSLGLAGMTGAVRSSFSQKFWWYLQCPENGVGTVAGEWEGLDKLSDEHGCQPAHWIIQIFFCVHDYTPTSKAELSRLHSNLFLRNPAQSSIYLNKMTWPVAKSTYFPSTWASFVMGSLKD